MSQVKLWLRDSLGVLVWLSRRLLGRGAPCGVRILLYHTIAEVPPERDPWRMSVPPRLFEAQLLWLRRHGYEFVSLDEALDMVEGKRAMPRKAVALTFDDGFRDTVASAYPVLKRDRIPATVFVVPSCLDTAGPFPWLDRGGPYERPMTWSELRALAADRLMSVGSHTWSHRRLSDLSSEAQAEEIVQSKDVLEARLGRPVRWFAYPYGHRGSFSSETITALQRCGFTAACANIMGMNRTAESRWTLRRTRIGWEDSLWRFRLKMAGAYDWVDRFAHWPRPRAS